jgi:hypothetical protein
MSGTKEKGSPAGSNLTRLVDFVTLKRSDSMESSGDRRAETQLLAAASLIVDKGGLETIPRYV